MDNEKQVERYLCQRVRRVGGKAYKWISPGCCGVPDRLVFLPGGVIIPVELKAQGRKSRLSEAQRQQVKRISEMGTRVYVLSTREEVDKFMQKQIAEHELTE